MERVIGGLNLPLPDALPDKRIYELLKTVDLENLSFADFQGVAKTIYAEQGAEDELRRIVLLNLARLSVKGNWDGLTSAGGGGGVASITGIIPDSDYRTGYGHYQNLLTSPVGWGRSVTLSNTAFNPSNTNQYLFPMYAAKSGDITKIQVHVGTAKASTNVEVGLYEVNTDGQPTNLLGKAEIDASSTGDITQTSFSSTITTTRGTLYFVGVCFTDAAANEPRLRGDNASSRFMPIGVAQSLALVNSFAKYTGSTGALDSSITLNQYSFLETNVPTVFLSWE